MTEHQIRDFEVRARSQVAVAEWDELERRADRRTLRRRAVVAVAAACVLGLAGYLAHPSQGPGVDLPARQPDQHGPRDGSHGAGTYPFPDSLATENAPLPAGSYELLISYKPFAPLVRFTVPAGWMAGNQPYRLTGDSLAVFGVFMLDAVTTTPCRVMDTGMTLVDDDPAAVASALAALPGERLVQPPGPDRRFGLPVTHLQLEETAAAQCPQGSFDLFQAGPAGYVSATGRPGTVVDFWVGSSDGYTFVVVTGVEPGTPQSVREELLGIVDSVRLVVE
jgi:hypothetical protein